MFTADADWTKTLMFHYYYKVKPAKTRTLTSFYQLALDGLGML